MHVGNFLSLATMKINMIPDDDDDDDGDGDIGISRGPECPPRHQVLCPCREINRVNILMGRTAEGDEDECG